MACRHERERGWHQGVGREPWCVAAHRGLSQVEVPRKVRKQPPQGGFKGEGKKRKGGCEEWFGATHAATLKRREERREQARAWRMP